MTAINTRLDQPADSQAYRRGLVAGAAASILLAGTLAAGALAAGVVQLPQAQAPAMPTTPHVETWSDYGQRLGAQAPAEVPPAPAEVVPPPAQVAPAPGAVPAPAVAPPAIAPPQNVRWDEYNQYNLLYKGTRGMF